MRSVGLRWLFSHPAPSGENGTLPRQALVNVFALALITLSWLVLPSTRAQARMAPAGAAALGAQHRTAVRAYAPALVGQAAFLLDDTTGRALYAYHADIVRYPASTIKMLTALIVVRRLSLGRIVTVPSEAVVDPVNLTSARLYAAERMTVRNLLYGLLLPSGNDAAITLADAVAGTSGAFARLMNLEAGRLHLWHSRLLGPTGLDVAGQYTTARDLAWLAHALLRNGVLAGIVRTRTYDAGSADGRYRHAWSNLNRLLWSYPGAIGVKTGTTPLAGANVVAAASRANHRIIAVVLGSTAAARFRDATSLLNYGWQLLKGRSP